MNIESSPSLVRLLRQSVVRLSPYFFKGRRSAWFLVVLATIIGAATEPLVPAMLKPLLDHGFQKGGLNPWLVPITLIGVFGLRGLSSFLGDVAMAKITQDGLDTLRTSMFGRLLDAQSALFAQRNASSLSNTIVYEVQNGAILLVTSVMGLAKDTMVLVALVAYLLYLNWQLTLILVVLFPSVAFVTRTLSRRLYQIAKSSQGATDGLAYVVEENVLAYRVVRLHAAQAAQANRFRLLSQGLRRLAMKSATASAAVTPMTHMMSAIALSSVICVALLQGSSEVSAGEFASYITAMLMLIAPVKRLSDIASPVTRGLAAMERALDLIEKTPTEPSGNFVAARAQGHIEFKSVTVRYRDDETRSALNDVSLTVAPGEVVALVGPSGSGKTSLVNLLPRFVSPHSGSVLVDGHDINEWQLKALRNQFAIVNQDVVMFNDTLAANVALGEAPDRARVEACLRAANLGGFLDDAPQGIDTMTGHNAAELSGGQRQRLAIARALYKDAPILILDEATSALDTESERLVQEALQRLMTGRTTLIIAHRLSTIEHADRVAVLDQGEITEIGTHDELIGKAGLYARLHALQFGTQPALAA
ncbi:lipid A export permease/ATP-binding protein MsbA [Rhodoferax sp.]|uniref:lipid A export permease/ATP-binding protein MsbA n=1 Tax=Rhodoferax sp. TaxID=50421 RepID=UPI00374D2B44